MILCLLISTPHCLVTIQESQCTLGDMSSYVTGESVGIPEHTHNVSYGTVVGICFPI